METLDIVVVGAGPTGLLLACELSLAGIHPVVLDRLPEPASTPKANGLVGEVVPLLDRRGLLERLTAEASFVGKMPGWQFGSVPLRFDTLPSSPLDAMVIQQPRMEAVLGQRADELSVEIRRGHELTGFSEHDGLLTVDVRGPGGHYRTRTRFLVGCDGARSTVRGTAGIAFPGDTGADIVRIGHFAAPEAKGAFDDRSDIDRLPAGVTRTPTGTLTVTSLHPGVRLVAVSEPNTGDHRGDVTMADFAASLHRVLGAEPPLGEPIWLTSTVAQARLAESYRRAGVFLAGDAAHLFPAGGSSLNVGLTDVINLGWKLAAAIKGWAPRRLLDSYHVERYPVAERALMQTRAQALLNRSDDEDGEALRALLTELFAFDEPLEHLGRILQGSDTRYEMPGGGPHPLVGRLVPDLSLITSDGPTRVGVAMRMGEPLLLDLIDRADVREVARPWSDRVRVLTARCDDPPAPALLVRPDGCVAWAADAEADLPTALSAWFGP